MTVSIIVPAYNSERFLAATLESVLAQTVKDWELVVVNDGSTDRTGTIAEAFARLDHRIRVVHQENAGIAGARNRGFVEAMADSEYCMLLDHDDLLEPDALDILLNVLEKDNNAAAAHGLLRYIDSHGKTLSVNGTIITPLRRRGIHGRWLKVWPTSAPTTFAVLAYANTIPANAIMMRRAKKEISGSFDSSCEPHDDWDLWLRLSRLGHIAFVNKVIYSHRSHENNTSKNRPLMRESMFYVRKKMYHADLDEREKRMIILGYRYHELYRARLSLAYAARKLLRGKGIDAYRQFLTAMRHIISSCRPVGSIFR